MFRRTISGLPRDPIFPADLKELGFFINSDDQIKSIVYPADCFRYFITDNERYNDVHRESMHAYIRTLVHSRLLAAGLSNLYLPSLTTVRPANTIPSLHILITPPHSLRQKQHVVVIFNKRCEDLGIWSYRSISGDAGINAGSMVSFIRAALCCPSTSDDADSYDSTMGVIISNPGQLLYSHRNDGVSGPNMTPTSWDALPRASAVHPERKIDSMHNLVAGSADMEEHLAFVLRKVVSNSAFVRPDARLYLFGVGDGGDELLSFLALNWKAWKGRIAALALTRPSPILVSAPPWPLHRGQVGWEGSWARLLRERARVWRLSAFALDTPLANSMGQDVVDRLMGNSQVTLWHEVGGGESEHAEGVAVNAAGSVAKWFAEVRAADETLEKGYVHPELGIPDAVLHAEEKQHSGGSTGASASDDAWSDEDGGDAAADGLAKLRM